MECKRISYVRNEHRIQTKLRFIVRTVWYVGFRTMHYRYNEIEIVGFLSYGDRMMFEYRSGLVVVSFRWVALRHVMHGTKKNRSRIVEARHAKKSHE